MEEARTPEILFLTCGCPPEQVGGVEQHTLELARSFREAGLETGFYARGDRGDLGEYSTYQDEVDGFPVTRVIYRWSKARSLKHIYDDEALGGVFSRFLERARPRVVHVHHLGGLGLSCLKVVKDSGIPLVMTLHDYWMICPRGQMFHSDLYSCSTVDPRLCAPCIAATWPALVPSGGGLPFSPDLPREDLPSVTALHDWLREILALPDLLLTPSEAARRRFLQFGVPADRIFVEENGLDPEPFEGLRREKSERLRVGFVGTLIPSKGVHVLLEAFARLPEGRASLLLAGNAPPFYQHTQYMEQVRELASRVPQGNPVKILGSYRHEDLPALLAEIDVLVVPPLWEEVFGLTLREGILSGAAVAASRVGGLPQAVVEGENGFTFPPGDAGALEEILRRFLEDPGLASRLGRGPKPVRTIRDLSRSLLDRYRTLAPHLPA